MRILYVASKFDYGRPESGFSFEHCNFYETLRRMGDAIVYFDYPTLLRGRGRDGMNRLLREVVKAEKPTLMFTFLAEEELRRDVVRKISDSGLTTTLNWFADDHWRFDGYSRFWAPCFNWVVTTDKAALPKYERHGLRNVIRSQWACNPFLYRREKSSFEFDVSFIGQAHGDRPAFVHSLERAGISIYVRGSGWPGGRLSQEEMIRVFNRSRINLNLSNASVAEGPCPGAVFLRSQVRSATEPGRPRPRFLMRPLSKGLCGGCYDLGRRRAARPQPAPVTRHSGSTRSRSRAACSRFLVAEVFC